MQVNYALPNSDHAQCIQLQGLFPDVQRECIHMTPFRFSNAKLFHIG